MATFFAFREETLGYSFSVEEEAILGLAPECDIILFSSETSPQHAKISSLNGSYFIADLGSTHGTLVNNQPITSPTKLQPYDSIKIGREIFIFEPGFTVITGCAPATIIISEITEHIKNLIVEAPEEAGKHMQMEDLSPLLELTAQLSRETEFAIIESLILSYLEKRFEPTMASILWPSSVPGGNLTSLMASHPEKRLLLSYTPFIQATRDRKAVLWPNSIDGLYFNQGKRQLTLTTSPSLVGPLDDGYGRTGMMCLENTNKNFTEQDFHTFAAFLSLVSPIITRWSTLQKQLKLEQQQAPALSKMIHFCTSTQVKILFSTAAQAATEPGHILIDGEMGTGKMALGTYIHFLSPRRNNPFAKVDLCTLAPDMIGYTIFGQTNATLADNKHVGMLEQAEGGTLFIKNVEYMPPTVQKDLLQSIEEGLFHTAGSPHPRAMNTKIICSTSSDLESLVTLGTFRKDLFHRLTRTHITHPPLRKMKDDLEAFINYFMEQYSKDIGVPNSKLSTAISECLKAYNWPGNMTELKTVVATIVLFSRNGAVSVEDLPTYLQMASQVFTDDGEEGNDLSCAIKEAERHHLVTALIRCQGNVEQVAELLQQKIDFIIVKIRHYGLDPISYHPLQKNKPLPTGHNSFYEILEYES